MTVIDISHLSEKISLIASSTPTELVDSVIPRLLDWDKSNWALSQAKALANIHNPQLRADFQGLFNMWEQDYSNIPGSAIALALKSSITSHAEHTTEQLDLVWTGPATHIIPIRRTDQALLQLIRSANNTLLIVSFAVYKIQVISEALGQAIQRGVDLRIVFEHPDESGGKISYTGSNALRDEVLKHAKFYTWPLDKREHNEDGKYGSLHAKVALADQDTLFISSANLTEYAMDLNMELGVLIHGGNLPSRVLQHFEQLILDKYLQRVKK